MRERKMSEPSGSSVLCESTAVVGSVGGLRGTEKSVQLSGETAAQEQWCRGGTGSAGKQRGQQEAAGGSRQQAVCSSSISGTSGSGSQSCAYSRHSGDRGFDSTLGHPGEDLGGHSSSQLSGGSGSGVRAECLANTSDKSDCSNDSAVATPITATTINQSI